MHGREDRSAEPAARKGEPISPLTPSAARPASQNDRHENQAHHPHADAGHTCDFAGCCGGHRSRVDHEVFVFSRSAIRELDHRATEIYAIPSILLMENAARSCAEIIHRGLSDLEQPAALIVCGTGNNGGDGLAIARHLDNLGVSVCVLLAGSEQRMTADARTNLTIVRAMGLPIVGLEAGASSALAQSLKSIGPPDVVVDAVLGTGADRPVEGPLAELIQGINALHDEHENLTLVAIDIPSGLDADGGLPAGAHAVLPTSAVIRADYTIALVGMKTGFLTLEAQPYIGEVVIADIGVPRDLVRQLGTPWENPDHDDLSSNHDHLSSNHDEGPNDD